MVDHRGKRWGGLAATVLGVAGILLLVVSNEMRDPDTRSTAQAFFFGFPLAAAPFVGLIVASWSRVRAPVEPAGLSRSKRILSFLPALAIAITVVGIAILLGAGHELLGVGALVAATVGFGGFLAEQIASRPPTDRYRFEERDLYDLRRTPGVSAPGAVVSMVVLVGGVADGSLAEAALWTSVPLSITLLGVYGAVAPFLAFRGSPWAVLFLLAAAATVVIGLAIDQPSAFWTATSVAAMAIEIGSATQLERARRAALLSATEPLSRSTTA